MIFWKARSTRPDCWRAQDDDRQVPWTAALRPGEGARDKPGQRLLSGAADLGRRSGADAPDRRAAYRASVRGQPDAAGHAEGGRPRSRPPARLDSDEKDGRRGDLPAARHLEAGTGP